MPELPEVETTRRGIEPHLLGRRVTGLVVREPRLRWPVPAALSKELPGAPIEAIERRGKYLLFATPRGTLIVHLGMSGSLRVLDANTPPLRHDHLDLLFESRCLRYHDPRRFGAVLWTREPPAEHPLLRDLGPEPLSGAFDGEWLHRRSRGRSTPVKSLIMDAGVVVGVGNIYANEALFMAGVHPFRRCDRVALERYRLLAEAIREVLSNAIAVGGTTLRDFVREDGRPGYFRQQLQVYGRQGEPCRRCGAPLRQRRLAQRSTFYCAGCQR